ncbi:NarK/NasA family nitrate transporter [Kocuria soli]|uniref:NarK/NasA family nitrate transporter n=1 Tax=Kocuria soli TaxID=2485125 RepID=A0A3N3ZWL9_9MICC|nr:MFS transporter [Kocuria soli]ROZ62860.1 NarK/NasA family nitrate transporter [Kocuria soli]
MSATQTDDALAAELKSGQLRNLLLATLASTMGFWAWTIIGPLSKTYAANMDLGAGQTSILVAMPILVGSVARVPVGALTDRYGGRVMFTLILGIAAPLVLLTAFVGQMNNFGLLVFVSFFLGIAGTVFAIGIPFSSSWYEAHRKGFATGVFGAGMVGTAVSAFFTPRLVAALGYMGAHVLIAALVALMAVICWLGLRESPTRRGVEHTPIMPKLKDAFALKETWLLCFMYAIVFGAFVAFSNYLPTYLANVYEFDPTAAGTRTAGFAAAAVVARPIGGTVADKIGPKIVSITSYVGAAVLAIVVAFQPSAEHVYGPIFILMALFLGLGTGGVFAWVARASEPRTVGTVSGIIAAAGGLGGYFPPLVMGATYNEAQNSYFVGLTLLAVFCALGLVTCFILRNGGKVDDRTAATA